VDRTDVINTISHLGVPDSTTWQACRGFFVIYAYVSPSWNMSGWY